MKKVAVTGASGHIGANLVRELLARNYEVVVLIRESSVALDGLAVVKVQGDLLDMQSLCRAFRGVEQVYHSAAYISVQPGDYEMLQAVNIDGTRNVIKACQSEGVSTLVYFSTIHALDQQPLDRAVTEENPLLDSEQKDSSGDYEYTKAQAERLVREIKSTTLSTRIIYPSAVIGPNDFNLSLAGQALLKLANRALPVLVSGGYDWVDVRDVCWGAIEATEKGTDKDRYILSGHYLTISEMAATIAEFIGFTAPRLSIPLWVARLFAPLLGIWANLRGDTPLYTRDSLSALSSNKDMSHELATMKLGYQPRSFRCSIRDTLNDYSANNHLEMKIIDD